MKTRRFSHTYKILTSFWGIRIAITATVLTDTDRRSGRGGSGVEVKFSDSAAALPSQYRSEIASGLARCEAEIVELVDEGRVVVDVERVSFVESDFQVEGLSIAMCRWAEAAFELTPRQISETFDRAANRYVFEWE